MPAHAIHQTGQKRLELFRKELLQAALHYGEIGYPVFPVLKIDGQKKPLVKWRKGKDHAANLTQRRATTDADTILAFWTRWPLAMIGMPTGARSGLIVVDVDRKNGVDGLETLRARGINPFESCNTVVLTPSGGYHFYYKYDGRTRNSAGTLGPGVDVRAEGGYVILPPSHPDPAGFEQEEYLYEYNGASLLS